MVVSLLRFHLLAVVVLVVLRRTKLLCVCVCACAVVRSFGVLLCSSQVVLVLLRDASMMRIRTRGREKESNVRPTAAAAWKKKGNRPASTWGGWWAGGVLSLHGLQEAINCLSSFFDELYHYFCWKRNKIWIKRCDFLQGCHISRSKRGVHVH